MAEMTFEKNRQSPYSLILGYVTASSAFIILKQCDDYMSVHPIFSIIILCSIFLSLSIGFLVAGLGQQLFAKHFKTLCFVAVIWLGIITSSLFLQLLQKTFTLNIVFSIYLITSCCLYAILGILIELIVLERQEISFKLPMIFLLGIVLGALITDQFFFIHLNLSWAIVFNAMLLLFAVIPRREKFFFEVITISLIFAIIIILFGVNIQIDGKIYANHQNFKINNKSYVTKASTNSIAEHLIPPTVDNQDDSYPYMPLLKKILFHDLSLVNQNVLIFGDGGYQLSKNSPDNIHFYYLGFTENVLPSACTYLNIMSKGDRFVSQSQFFLNNTNPKFNVIVANIFPNNFVIPNKLLSYQHILAIRNALPNNGIAIFNVQGIPTLIDTHSKIVDNTIRAVFPNCMELPLAYGNKQTNILYVCHKSAEETNNSIYSDEE